MLKSHPCTEKGQESHKPCACSVSSTDSVDGSRKGAQCIIDSLWYKILRQPDGIFD